MTTVPEAFDQLMMLLPLWLPIVVIGVVVQWFVVRSAALAALRAHGRVSTPESS